MPDRDPRPSSLRPTSLDITSLSLPLLLSNTNCRSESPDRMSTLLSPCVLAVLNSCLPPNPPVTLPSKLAASVRPLPLLHVGLALPGLSVREDTGGRRVGRCVCRAGPEVVCDEDMASFFGCRRDTRRWVDFLLGELRCLREGFCFRAPGWIL